MGEVRGVSLKTKTEMRPRLGADRKRPVATNALSRKPEAAHPVRDAVYRSLPASAPPSHRHEDHAFSAVRPASAFADRSPYVRCVNTETERAVRARRKG